VVETVLTEVYGQPIRIKVLLEREVETVRSAEPSSEEGDLLGEAIKILGVTEENS
jgi:hypothetical protein